MTLLFFLLACAGEGDASLYARALHAATFEAQQALCDDVRDAAARSDCDAAGTERFGRYEGCGTEAMEPWRSECFFRAAEALAHRGDHVAAMHACAVAGLFARNCDTHVMESLAMAHLRETLPEAATAIGAVAGEVLATTTTVDFWRAWVRNRIREGLPVEPEACDDRWCTAGTRHEIKAAVETRMKEDGCQSRPFPPWATSAGSQRWVREISDQACSVESRPGPG